MAWTPKEPEFVVDGREGLRSLLDSFLQKSEKDQEFASSPHYILFQLNAMQSLIRVDMSQRPFQFWHYNIQERAALPSLKDTIISFLQEKCGEKDPDKNFHDLYTKLRQGRIDASFSGETMPLPENPVQHGLNLLAQEKRPVVMPVIAQPREKESVGRWFSFFSKKPQKQTALKVDETREPPQKKVR